MAGSVKAPGWLTKRGAARVQSELRSLTRSIQAGSIHGVTEVSTLGDDLMTWRILVSRFDEDTAAGRALNRDLLAVGCMYGCFHLVLEARFPDDYPASPFFLRVVKPRCVMYSGHVTAGGSVCIEALTQSGGPGAWRPDLCVEGVLAMTLFNMLNAEEVWVRTAAGGGQAGPLKIDLARGRHVVQEYGLAEAHAAFQRTVANHGWTMRSAGRAAAPSAAAANAAANAVAAGAGWAAAGAAAGARPSGIPLLRVTGVGAAQPAAAPAQAADAAMLGASRGKRPAVEVVDLLSSDSEDDGPAAIVQSRAQAARGPPPVARHSAGTSREARAAGQVLQLIRSPARGARAVADGGGRTRPGATLRAEAVEAATELAQPSIQGRLAAANAAHGLHLVMPPARWRVSDATLQGRLEFVELRLAARAGHAPAEEEWDDEALAELTANGLSREAALSALRANGGDPDASLAWVLQRQLEREGSGGQQAQALAELRANGLGREDAEAALQECGGNVERALEYAFETMDRGGPAAVARRRSRQPAATAQSTAAAKRHRKREAEERRRRAECEEVESVLARFEAQGGLARSRVRRVERVQNLLLRSDYERRKARIQLETAHAGPSGLNEKRLWHGADKDTLCCICAEGFDSRVSNLNGMYGAGNYFADSSSYSDHYSRQAKHSAEVTAAAGRMTAGLPGGVPAGGSFAQLGAPAARPAGPAGAAKPRFLPGCVAMLLCDVVLGASGAGHAGMRRPPPGVHSTIGGSINAVYLNDQAYPAYVVHYQ